MPKKTRSTLPPDAERLTRYGDVLVAEPCHRLADLLRLVVRLQPCLRGAVRDRGREARPRHRHHDIDLDALVGTGHGQRPPEAHHPALRCAVVKVVVVPKRLSRGGEDKPSVGRLLHCRPGRSEHVECANKVGVDNTSKLVVGDHVEAVVWRRDPGVVHHDVQATPGIEGLFDHGAPALARRHRVAIGDGLAACSGDLFDDLLGRLGRCHAGPIGTAAKIVDHDAGSPGGKQRACDRPSPRPPPVMSATRPSKRNCPLTILDHSSPR